MLLDKASEMTRMDFLDTHEYETDEHGRTFHVESSTCFSHDPQVATLIEAANLVYFGNTLQRKADAIDEQQQAQHHTTLF